MGHFWGGLDTPGFHTFVASIQDGDKGANAATSQFALSPPIISTIAPGSAAINASITITGAGYDSTCSNNSVRFDGVLASPPTGCSPTSLQVTVPGSPTAAKAGPVTVEVDNLVSKPYPFTVIQAPARTNISGLTVNPQQSNHIMFTDKTTGYFYEILDDGSIVTKSGLVGSITGSGRDGTGTVYFGVGNDASTTGRLQRWTVASQTNAVYADTRISGESNASIYGTAADGAGNVYTADHANGKVKKVTSALVVSALQTGMTVNYPTGLAANNTTNKLYFTWGPDIDRIDIPNGGNLTTTKSGYGDPTSLELLPDGSSLLVARSTPGTVSVLNPSNGDSFDLATGITGLRCAASGNDGQPFVAAATGTQVFRIATPTIDVHLSSGGSVPSTIVIDQPFGSGNCNVNAQITLEATFAPTTLMPANSTLTWTLIDPDDPATDSVIDDNGSNGDDNATKPGDAGYTPWEQVAPYTLSGLPTSSTVDTLVVGNKSQVKFHLSCHPGDNYIFRASVTVQPYGTISASSGILTLWRTLHVETDSMGVNTGPYDADDDDALVGDIPELPSPDFVGLLAEVLKPAYIQVVAETALTSPSVEFQYHVDPTPAAVKTQVDRGRGQSSDQSHWAVTVQSGYEPATGSDNKTNDPDDFPNLSNPYFGMTNSAGDSSLVLIEVCRDVAAQQLPEPILWDDAWLTLFVGVHEVMHQFKLEDGTGSCGIMSAPPSANPVLQPYQIRWIRHDLLFPQSGQGYSQPAPCGP